MSPRITQRIEKVLKYAYNQHFSKRFTEKEFTLEVKSYIFNIEIEMEMYEKFGTNTFSTNYNSIDDTGIISDFKFYLKRLKQSLRC